eukprot:03058.XXX_121803_124157_1 [CDS] Oithona nana genome sequencing.
MDLKDLEVKLLQPDFDVEKFASSLLQTGVDIGKYANELSVAEEDLNVKLEDHVSAHHNDLLSQATSVERLESHLTSVSDQSVNLLTSVDKITSRINEPYETMKTQTETLMRMQKTCDVLRKIIRILQLSKKLQVQMNNGDAEITKAASSLNELMELWEPEEELNGIEIIEQDQRIILQAKNEVERKADSMLNSGMESRSQNQIGIALQVYFNLNILPEKVERVVNGFVKKIKAKMTDCLDGRKINITLNEEASKNSSASQNSTKNLPGRTNRTISATASSGNAAAFRSMLWTNVETLLDSILNTMSEAMQLQKILVKKRDLGQNFVELLNEDQRNIVQNFWHEILSLLKTHLSQASADSSTIKQSFEGEFPKLIRLVNDLRSRLVQASQSNMAAFNHTSEIPELQNPFNDDLNDDLRQVLINFERQYLSRSLSRLFDPVNLMYVQGEAPNIEELDQIFRIINSEIAIAQVDKLLYNAVQKNVIKTVKLMCAKCEQLLDGSASQVIGYPTNEQRKNVQVVNCLFAFYVGIEKVLENPEVLKEIEVLIKSAIEPLMASISDAVEAIILTMHNEDFKTEEDKSTCSSSPYLKELQTFLHRVHLEFLNKFNCKTLVAESSVPLFFRCYDLFIMHSSMIKPLSKMGQDKLIKDCDTLEEVIKPISDLITLWDASILESKVQELREFRTLLRSKTEDFPALLQSGMTIRKSVILHMLFSRAPPELKLPHQSVNWSISRYSTWLEDHTGEPDRLQLVQGALESYVASTRARNEKSYAYPYNIMLGILQSAK